MENAVRFFYAQGLATSSQKSYRSAQSRYLSFCAQFQLQPLPLSEPVLCSFVSLLASQSLRFQTIKCYLSGLRHMQISSGYSDPFAGNLLVRLDYVLKGIKRCQASGMTSSSSHPRLPITPSILRAIRSQWSANWNDYDIKMLWAAFCVGFFGFMRAGEFTVPANASYDPGCHLSFRDIAVDSHINPSVMHVSLRASKTDPFRKGVTIVIGTSKDELCPVNAVLSYLAVRGAEPGPLFRFAGGRCLTRERLVSSLRHVLAAANIDTTHFSGHSFRIGAATTAARVGVEDSLIKTLGRRESSAYMRYIRTSTDQLAAIALRLSSS